jgi:hypothetical protein
MYHKENAKYHAEQILHELERIERFIKTSKKALSALFADNVNNDENNRNDKTETLSTITNTYILSKNNAEEKNGIGQKKQIGKNEQNMQYLQIVQNMYSKHFAQLSDIEFQRVTSPKSIMDGADVYRQLLKQGYTAQSIEQAVYSARMDSFWNGQFRTLRKLLRKNKDGVLYIDVFLALNQSRHKLSVPKIIR